MGSLAVTQLISLVVVVAAIGATGGFIAAVVARRKKRRARGSFMLGLVCGFIAGSVLLARRRGQNTFTAAARGVGVRALKVAMAGAGRDLVPSRFPAAGPQALYRRGGSRKPERRVNNPVLRK